MRILYCGYSLIPYRDDADRHWQRADAGKQGDETMDNDLQEYSDDYLQNEFYRLVRLRDESQESITAIRAEQDRREYAEIAKVLSGIAARKGGAA